MAEEIKHILTTETFSEFDRCFRDTVFDRKNPFGYKKDSSNKYVPIEENETNSTSGVTQIKAGKVKAKTTAAASDSVNNINSYVLATNADIEAMFTS